MSRRKINRVRYHSLNYKTALDALSARGVGGEAAMAAILELFDASAIRLAIQVFCMDVKSHPFW